MRASLADTAFKLGLDALKGCRVKNKERLIVYIDYWADRMYLHQPDIRENLYKRAGEYFNSLTISPKSDGNITPTGLLR